MKIKITIEYKKENSLLKVQNITSFNLKIRKKEITNKRKVLLLVRNMQVKMFNVKLKIKQNVSTLSTNNVLWVIYFDLFR